VFRGHESWVESAVFSHNGQRIASASLDDTVRVWDANSGRQIAALCKNGWAMSSVVFAANGNIVCGSYDGSVQVWDALSWEQSPFFVDMKMGSPQ